MFNAEGVRQRKRKREERERLKESDRERKRCENCVYHIYIAPVLSSFIYLSMYACEWTQLDIGWGKKIQVELKRELGASFGVCIVGGTVLFSFLFNLITFNVPSSLLCPSHFFPTTTYNLPFFPHIVYCACVHQFMPY